MSVRDTQVGGTHYQLYKPQPLEYFITNEIPYAEGSAIAYILRHGDKGGAEDLRKAIHTLQFLLKVKYEEEP